MSEPVGAVDYFNEQVKEFLPLLKLKDVTLPTDIFLIQTSFQDNILKALNNQGKELRFKLQKVLGIPGKEGTAMLFRNTEGEGGTIIKALETNTNHELVAKVFKPGKKIQPVVKELGLQWLANHLDTENNHLYRMKVAPEVIGIIPNPTKGLTILEAVPPAHPKIKDGIKVFMEKMDKTLVALAEEKGELTPHQQYDLVYLALSLDMKGLRHNDPNPLNYMIHRGHFYQIDYGFSKLFDREKAGLVNIKALNHAFFSGGQGIVTRKKCKTPEIIKEYIEMAKNDPDKVISRAPLLKKKAGY